MTDRLSQLLVVLDESTADDLTDGPLDEVGHVYGTLRAIARRSTELVEQIEAEIAASMESDLVSIGRGLRLHRTTVAGSPKWNNDSVRSDVRDEVVARVARDKRTGELDPVWRGIATETFDLVAATWSLSSPKTGRDAGIRQLGLDPNEYRTFGPDRYSVGVELDGIEATR